MKKEELKEYIKKNSRVQTQRFIEKLRGEHFTEKLGEIHHIYLPFMPEKKRHAYVTGKNNWLNRLTDFVWNHLVLEDILKNLDLAEDVILNRIDELGGKNDKAI